MNRKLIAILLICAMLIPAAFTGCGKASEKGESSAASEEASPEIGLPEYPVQVGDYTVSSRPIRVVSLSPAITEKLYDLGLEDRLVGVSKYCDYPESADAMPKCGTAKIPDIDLIDELDAHMVISETPMDAETIEQLLEWDIDVVVLSPARSLNELYYSYESLCRIMEGEYAGGEMGERFLSELYAWVEGLRRSVSGEERKLALYIRKLPFTVATGDTLVNDLLNVIGLDNVAAEHTNWIVDEETARGELRATFEAADIFFFDPNDADYPVSIKDLEQSDYYKSLRATLKDLYLEIDVSAVERQSLRTFQQFLEMAAYAHPDANLPAPFRAGATAPVQSDTAPVDDEPGEDVDEPA